MGDYRDRPDISILVVEKNANPLFNEKTKHDIWSTAYYFSAYGFSVDMVWTLTGHRFDDINKITKPITDRLDEMLREALVSHKDVRKFEEESARRYIDRFARTYDLLRKTPINSVEDLAGYDFLIVHPLCDDCEMLESFALQYPDKPIIIPTRSAAAGEKFDDRPKFPIEGIYKVPNKEQYGVEDGGFTDKVLDLIEYLLDKKTE